MLTREDVVTHFHKAFSHPVDERVTPQLLDFRMKLISEEFEELLEAVVIMASNMEVGNYQVEDYENVIKELADIQYVISGFAVSMGIPLQTVFNRVHLSNMSKLGSDGKPILRSDGKVLKSENYRPPSLIDLIPTEKR